MNGEPGVLRSKHRRVKQTEERNRLQSQLLDEVGQAVIVTDPQGKIVYCNRAAERLYGWSVEEVMGRSVVKVTLSRELVERAAEIMSALRAGRSRSGKFVVRRKDGTSFRTMLTDTPLHDEQGTMVSIIGVSADVTELEHTQQLRRGQERFRSLVRNASDIIAILEPDGTVRYVSPAVQGVFAYCLERAVGERGLDLLLVHPADAELASSVLAQVLRTPRAHPPLKVRVARKDGSWRYPETTSTDLLDDPTVRGIT